MSTGRAAALRPERAREAEPAQHDAPVAASQRTLRFGSRLALYLTGVLVAGALAPPGLRTPLVVVGNAVLAVLFGLDALRLWRADVRVRRAIEPRIRVQSETSYTLHVHSQRGSRVRARLRDTVPATMECTPLLHDLTLSSDGSPVTLHTRVVPLERGRAAFGDVYLRVQSALGLAAVMLRVPLSTLVHVVPEATLERKANRKGPRLDMGNVALRIRRASQGSELESLREYGPGDPLRAIDWKATAKRRHPVTRLYQPERSQTLWFVLDASRTMAASIGEQRESSEPPPGQEQADAPSGGAAPGPAAPGKRRAKTRFDVALEAMLVVADGALRAGDQVGVLVYGDELELLIPPGRGRAQYRRLVDMLADVHAKRVQLDVRGLVSQLERRARKRSLLVLFTDLENETHGEALHDHARVLTRRHLVLCVSLDDSITRALADAPTQGGDAAVFERAAAIDMLRERTELTHKLEKRHVLVLTADESGLARATLDRYLDVKTRGLL